MIVYTLLKIIFIFRCFEINEKSCLDHFFSLFFTRLLINGFLSDGTQQCNLENLTNDTYLNNTSLYGFEDILPYAGWVPLPKEAQVNINKFFCYPFNIFFI